MLMLLSPAKTLDYESPLTTDQYTLPRMLDDSARLIEVCRQLTAPQLASLMSLSDKLAGLNVARFAQWQPECTADNSRPALFAFKGDVYTGLQAETLSDGDLAFAQTHLRMLSGLYGLLRPLDRMQAYRLEMGTKLANQGGADLYAFWGHRITALINEDLAAQGDDLVVNLASNEYFKAVQPKAVQGRIISPVFQDQKNGQYKIISFYAKKARGLMARYIIQHRLTDPADLLDFDLEEYAYAPDVSTPDKPVFRRPER